MLSRLRACLEAEVFFDFGEFGVGAGGWEDLGCGKGLETPFSLLGVGHAAGEFGDFDEEGVVLLAPVDDEFVAHVSGFYAAAKSRSRVARTEGVGSFSSLDRRCSISSRTVTQRLA